MILTIDQGTTSSRAIIFNEHGNIVELHQKEYPLIYPKDGWVEINPSTLLESVETTINSCKTKDLKVAAITNQRETTIVWDRDTGEPIYNAIVWQDRRTSNFCDDIRNESTLNLIKEKTGLVLDPYFSATKIKWILDNVPEARNKANAGKLMFGTVDTFLLFKLSKGKIFKTDYTNASRTMLFNINSCQWDKELLQLSDIPESMLPEACPSDSNFGAIEPFNAEVNAVLGDQHAALFGQNCLNENDLKSTYGTGCFLMANTGTQPISSTSGLLTTIGFSFGGEIKYAIEGSIYSAGTITQWLRDQLEFFSEAKDSENFLNNNFLSNGVCFIPAFNGLGAPYWNSEIRGSFHGLTRDSSKHDLITAAISSISFQTKDIIQSLAKDNINVDALKIDGGMIENQWFINHLSNTTNLKVVLPKNKESTAFGVAMMAAISSGISSIEVLTNSAIKEIHPKQGLINQIEDEYNEWKTLLNKQLG